VPPADPLRRKLTVRAHGRTLVLLKRPGERGEHVVQKALLWVRYLPVYPDLRVEQPLPFPARYKPDLYAADPSTGGVVFWGECGVVSAEKLRALLRGHPGCHFAFTKWATRLGPFAAQIDGAIAGVRRRAPVELLSFPPDAADWLERPGGPAWDADAVDGHRWEP
jgi:hypothetical protein